MGTEGKEGLGGARVWKAASVLFLLGFVVAVFVIWTLVSFRRAREGQIWAQCAISI